LECRTERRSPTASLRQVFSGRSGSCRELIAYISNEVAENIVQPMLSSVTLLHGWSRQCRCRAASGSGVDLLPHDLSTPEPRRKMKLLEALSKKEGPPGKTTRRASIETAYTPDDRSNSFSIDSLREGRHNKWTHRTMTKGVFRPSDSRLPQA